MKEKKEQDMMLAAVNKQIEQTKEDMRNKKAMILKLHNAGDIKKSHIMEIQKQMDKTENLLKLITEFNTENKDLLQ